MNVNRLPDYLGHMQQAAADARSFVDGMDKVDFLAGKLFNRVTGGAFMAAGGALAVAHR